MNIITFPDGNDVIFKTTLSGTEYTLRILWNQKGQYWTLSIGDIIKSIKVVCNYPLLNGYSHLAIPAGQLVCTTIDETLQRPLRDSFTNGKCYLVYAVQTDL